MPYFLSDKPFLKPGQLVFIYLPVVILSIFLVLTGIYLDRIHNQSLQQEKRHQLVNQLAIVRAQIEGNISSNTQLIQGLVISMSVEPDMTQERFKSLSDPLLENYNHIRNIAAAPDLVIQYMNPVIGNEAAIGLDYRTVADQYEGVKLARDTGKLILVGPVNLVQGGQGFIVRAPVYITNRLTNQKRFWGVIASVIDVHSFLDASALMLIEQGYDIAIKKNTFINGNAEVFYGDANVFTRDPVVSDIVLPYGSWTLAAAPKSGWLIAAEDEQSFTLMMVIVELLVLIPFIILTYNIHRKRESDERLRLLFETSPVGIALNDFETGRFVEVNNALLKSFGYSKSELLKLSDKDVTPHRYKELDQQQLNELSENGKYGPVEKEYFRHDGSCFPVLLRGVSITDAADGKMIWSFVEDISSRKTAEVALRRSQKMDAIGQLTGGIAHDFNNILNVILGNLDLLKIKLGDQPDSINERIESIQSAGERAADLTKQLLSFARKKSSRRDVSDINFLVTKMDTLISRSATPEVKIIHNLADSIWMTELDQGEFEDVLLNLCINARDAMSSHGILTIETNNIEITDKNILHYPGAYPGDFVELVVRDTGSGIPEEYIQNIFEPFFTTKKEGKGTGLGLSMVYGFVTRCHGFINVDSSVGSGTCFRLFFPRSYGQAVSPILVDSTDTTKMPRGSESILMVDDEKALLELVSEQLISLGYKVVTAENAKQALDELKQNSSYDLVFSDVVMPGDINGYALADQVMLHYPHIKVLLTSGYTGGVKEQSTVDHKLNENILKKPYSKFQLASRLREVLDSTDT